jgi:hypothetical protein
MSVFELKLHYSMFINNKMLDEFGKGPNCEL